MQIVIFILFFYRLLFPIPTDGFVMADLKTTALDFKRINEAYLSVPGFSEHVQYKMFDTYTSKKPSAIYIGFYNKSQNNFHSFLLKVETLQNAQYNIAVDTINKVMVIKDPAKNSGAEIFSLEIEKVITQCSKVMLKQNAKTKWYRMEFSQPASPYSCIELEVSQVGLINRIVLYFNKEIKTDPALPQKAKPRVEIEYTDLNMHPRFGADEFSEKKFIDTKKSPVGVNQNYPGFRIVNQKRN